MKDYLNRALAAEARIKSRMEQIGRIKALAARAERTLPEGAGKRETEDRLQAMQDELHAEIAAWAAVKQQVADVIGCARKENHRQLLEYRYLCGWDWLRIANGMHYSLDRIRHLHADALRALEQDRQKITDAG